MRFALSFVSWIQSQLHITITEFEKHLADYRFDLCAQILYDFTWNEYCGWYIELSKPVFLSEDSSPEEKAGTRQTLVNVLDALNTEADNSLINL